MGRFASYVSVAALLVGCGPSLSQVTRTTQAFAVQQKCAQGPFEVHVPAYGSKWGEDVTLEARGANAIDGHATVTIDGREVGKETFSASGVASNACMLSDADRAAAVTGGPAITMPSTTDSSSTNTNTSTSTSTTALVPAGLPSEAGSRVEIARYHREVNEWSQAQDVLKKGQDVKIVFWSEHPLDLSTTTFVLTHAEMVPPDGDDKKWQAHLDEVKADAEKKEREAKAEWTRKQAELQAEARAHAAAESAKVREQERCRGVNGPDDKCKDAGFKTGSEIAAYDALQHKCEEMARRNATDKECRDDGWRNDNERPDYNAPAHVTNLALAQPPPPVATVETKPAQRAADRPPPPPQAETQPPKPSEHAEWVPGSWQWNGTSDWVWLGGGWRVPEQDRAQHLTATAPTAPPAVRVEAPPAQPIASAVWAPGYWHYAGQWIWVPGHWAVPPRAGATWRPSTYVPEGVQLRLDPGGWILH